MFEEQNPDLDESLKEIAEYYRQRNYDYLYLRLKLGRAIAGRERKGKTLIVGSSHALNGILEEYFADAVNLSMHSQDLYYDFRLTRQVIEHEESKTQKCLIIMGYYIPYQDLSMQKIQREITITQVYYPLLKDAHHWEEPTPWDFWGLEIPDDVRNVCEKMAWISMNSQRNYFENGRERGSAWFNSGNWWEFSETERIAYGKARAEQHNRLTVWKESFQESKEIFRDYIHYLVLHKITPIVLVTPFCEEYTRYLDPAFRNGFYELLCSAREDVNLMDFNEPGILKCFGAEDYTDMDHLNQQGAKKLSTYIAEAIRNIA